MRTVTDSCALLTMIILCLCAPLVACSRHPAVLALSSDLYATENCGRLPANTAFAISQLRFFISDLTIKVNGQWQAAALIPSGQQTDTVALIDLTPDCAGDQTANIPLAISYQQLAKAEAIGFTIGLPFALNHQNPITQPAPLNDPAMFWTWQTGYKFIRWDMQHAVTGRGWSFHHGSLGCSSPSALRAPAAACEQPNTVRIEVEKPTAKGVLFLQMQRLLRGIDLDTSQGCMFHRPEEKQDCQRLQNNLHSDWVVWRDE